MDYSEQIAVIQREMTINAGILEQEYWHTGTAALEHPEVGIKLRKDSTYREEVEHISSLQKDREELLESIERIEDLQSKIGDHETGIAGREAERNVLDEQIAREYIAVGTSAFDVYATSPQLYSEYSQIFARLDAIYRERYDMESKIEATKKKVDTDPAILKLLSKTKLQMQKNSLTGIEKKTEQEFASAGKTIVENWYDAGQSDERLQGILKSSGELREKRSEIEKIISRHQESISELRKELAVETGKQKPASRVHDLQLRISEIDEELRNALTALGKELAGTIAKDAPEPIKGYVDNIASLGEENLKKEKLLVRLQAAQKITALESEKSGIELKKRKLEKQKTELEDSIASLAGKISDLEKSIREQGKIRGDEKELS